MKLLSAHWPQFKALRQRYAGTLGDFFSNTLGLEVPVPLSPATIISRLLSAAAKNTMVFHGDRMCTAQLGATKAHDWFVSVLGPLFCTRLPNCPGSCFRC
jgi:hypothetical protein